MLRIHFRILGVLILALASSACSGASASPTNPPEETMPATWTAIAPTQEATPISEVPSDTNPPPSDDSTLTPTVETSGGETPPPPGDSTAAPTSEAPATGTTPLATSRYLCDDSQFVEDVSVPDGTVLTPGQDFEKIWKFKNTGSCTWTTSYAIGYAYGAKMQGAETKLLKSVAPGATVDVSVRFTAPMPNCWYGSWWRLKNERGDYFGDFVYVSVIVSNGMENGTPYPTLCVG